MELLGGFGDLVIALPAIQALGRSHPEVPLDVLTVRPGGELLTADPLVDSVFTTPADHAADAVAELLSRQRYHLVVTDTRHSGIPALIEAHVRGTGGESVSDLWRRPPADQSVRERFIELLVEAGVVHPGAGSPGVIQLRERHGPTPEGTRVVLLPHAGTPLKRWPPSRFAEVADMLAERHPHLTFIVPLGPGQRLPPPLRGLEVVATPALTDLAAQLSTAALAIGGDTGALHLAAALGVPTVSVFGPTWGERYGPGPGHAVLQGMPCCDVRTPSDFTSQRCWSKGNCPIRGWRSCTEAIPPAWVVEAADRLLFEASDRDRAGAAAARP